MTTSAYPLLESLRDHLGAVPGVVTSRIGLEANMTPADYPMVRIVPSKLSEGRMIGHRGADCLVYFGMPIHEFTDGLEAIYEQLMGLESSLIAAAQAWGRCQYLDTITDEGRTEGYALMALRLRIEG